MKFEIVKVSENPVMFDTDFLHDYKFLNPSEDDEEPLPTVEVAEGVRFTLPMHTPGPQFFFGVADLCDESDECVIVHQQSTGLMGCYCTFKKGVA